MLDLCLKSRTDQVGAGAPVQAPLARQATTKLTILQAILRFPCRIRAGVLESRPRLLHGSFTSRVHGCWLS